LNENVPCHSYKEVRGKEQGAKQCLLYMREYMKNYYQKEKDKEGGVQARPLA
jgi:hypothetical protein